MDFKVQLAIEHSRSNTDVITKAIGSSSKKFKEIVDIIYNEQPPLPQRASWLLAAVNEKHPELIAPYIPLFVTTVEGFKIDGIKRNMLSALSEHAIPEELQGQLVNTCFEFLLSPDETVAVKVFAMQIVANIAEQHPELQNELTAVIEDQLPKSSAAFHARAKRVLKKFNANTRSK